MRSSRGFGQDSQEDVTEDTYDVVVIGAGIGGLTCGGILAKNGLSTLVVEQHSKPGGYVTSYKKGKFVFDVPHVISGLRKNSPVERVVSYLGLKNDIKFIESEPYQKFIYPEHTIRAYTNMERYISELVNAFPKEKANIHRYFETLTTIWNVVTFELPYQPRKLDYLRALVKWRVLTKYKTYRNLLDKHFSDERLKSILSSQWEYLGLPASKISAIAMAMMLMTYHDGGAWYPRRGYEAMAEAFANGLKKHDGTLLLSTPVAKILIDDRRAVGVKLADGREIKARYIISNADTKLTFLRLVGEHHLSKKFAKKIRNIEPSVSGFVVHLGVKMELEKLDLKYGTVFYYPTYDNPERQFRQGVANKLVTDPDSIGLMLSVPSLKDPASKLAPDGHHCLDIQYMPAPYNYRNKWMTQPQGKRGALYKKLKEDFAKKLIKVAEKVIPDLSKHIVVRDIATPLTYERYTLSSGGGWYDATHTPEQFGWNRLPAKTPIPGLYLTGAGTYPSAGMFGSIISGLLTADVILQGALTRGKFRL